MIEKDLSGLISEMEKINIGDHCQFWLDSDLEHLLDLLKQNGFLLMEKTKKIAFDESGNLLPDDKLPDYYIFSDKDNCAEFQIADNQMYKGVDQDVKNILDQTNFKLLIDTHPPKYSRGPDVKIGYRKALMDLINLLLSENKKFAFYLRSFHSKQRIYISE